MNLINYCVIESAAFDSYSNLSQAFYRINSEHNDGAAIFFPDTPYLCLGFTAMSDDIVLVADDGRVFALPYEEDVFNID